MAYTRATIPAEVTFITPTGPMEIRMSKHTTDAIRAAARALNARLYVSVTGWHEELRVPVWGVIDTKLDQVLRYFPVEDSKPAVIFAMMQGSR